VIRLIGIIREFERETMQEESRVQKRIVIHYVGMTYSGIAGNVEALRDVNLMIEPGEFICLVGPSGCGKTTLLNVVAGFLEPTAGEVSIDGRKSRTRTGSVRGVSAICGFSVAHRARERGVRAQTQRQ